MLDRDLEDAEEQYGTALRGHLQIIDSLLDLQYARMRGLRQQFDAQLKARAALEAVNMQATVCQWQLPACKTVSLPAVHRPKPGHHLASKLAITALVLRRQRRRPTSLPVLTAQSLPAGP